MGVLPKEKGLSPECDEEQEREALSTSTVRINESNRAHNDIDNENNERGRFNNSGNNDNNLQIFTINTVQIGCVYDILDSKNRWCEGEIIKIDQLNKRVYVSYVYWDNDHDEWVNDLANRIAPKHTHTYIEGGVLKLRQRVEALDEQGNWLQAFVIEEEPEKVKIHFKGYASKFDRWIRRDQAHGNIRPFGRMRLQLKYLQEHRHRDFLNNSNMKWSVPGMNSALVSAANARPKYANNNSSSLVYEESKDFGYGGERIVCLENDERTRKIADMSDKFQHYLSALERHHLRIVRVSGDGNCLFRSVAHQIYGDESLHGIVRDKCMDYMEAEADFFSQFVVGGREMFHIYLDAKRRDGCWGDDPEIEAICELYDRPAEIWAYDPVVGAKKLRTFHESVLGLLLSNNSNNLLNSPPSSSSFPRLSNDRMQRNISQDQENEENMANDNMMNIVDPAEDQAPYNSSHRIHTNISTATASTNNASLGRLPLIRLSYYGGGHYDSVVSDIDHLAGLLRDPPGTWEDSRIRQSKRFHAESHRSQALLSRSQEATPMALQTPSSLTLSQRHRTQWQLEEANQAKQQEEQVIRLSQEQARQREETDLETTLLLSLQQHQQSQTQHFEDDDKAVLQLVVQESKQEYERLQQEYEVGNMVMDDDDEDVLLALALAQSKDSTAANHDSKLVGKKDEKADDKLANSLTAAAVSGALDSKMLAPPNLSEEEALRLAIAQSLQSQIPSSQNNANPSNNSYANSNLYNEAKFSSNLLEDEDALLQQALAESLTQHSQWSNTTPHITTAAPVNNVHNNSNNNTYSKDYLEEDDPELLLAIQESLRK